MGSPTQLRGTEWFVSWVSVYMQGLGDSPGSMTTLQRLKQAVVSLLAC